MNFILITLVALFVLFVLVMVTWFGSKPIPQDMELGMTGGVKQGKTKVGVKVAVSRLKKFRFLWSIGLLVNKEIPNLYSNIPLQYKNGLIVRFLSKIFRIVKLPKYEMAITLEYEHLMQTKRINQHSVLFVDELSTVADQYDYDNPLVDQFFADLIQYFGHYIDGAFIWTAHSLSKIPKPIRMLCAMAYNLFEFRRVYLWFYKVKVNTIAMVEEMTTIRDAAVDEEVPYFFGYLPFKYFKFIDISRLFAYKSYDPRAFSKFYDHVLSGDEHRGILGQFKTMYRIDIPKQKEMYDLYKKQGFISVDQMRQYVEQWNKSRPNKIDA